MTPGQWCDGPWGFPLLPGSPDRAGFKWRRINLSVIILHYQLFALTQASGHHLRLFMSERLSRSMMLCMQTGNPEWGVGIFLHCFQWAHCLCLKYIFLPSLSIRFPVPVDKTTLNTSLNTHLALLFLEQLENSASVHQILNRFPSWKSQVFQIPVQSGVNISESLAVF